MSKLNVFCILCLLPNLLIAGAKWPSPEQIEYVENKRAGFPWQNSVSNIDWYSPLETVKGNINQYLTNSTTKKSIQISALENAAFLAEKHNSYALLVWHKGQIQLEKYWESFNLNSRFETASMHKTVVAVLIGIAVDEGKIKSIEQPLSDYLINLKHRPIGKVSLRALMEMSSGVSSPKPSNDPAGLFWQTYLGTDLKEATYRTPVESEPFEEFFYSNANPQYLAWVIEKATGKRYANYLSEKLWRPLGAQNASVWLDKPSGNARSSCCLIASARDWLKFGLLLKNKGKVGNKRLVSESWITDMIAPSQLNPNYGRLLWLGSPHNSQRHYNRNSPAVIPAKEPFLADDVAYLDGWGGQRVYTIPSQDLVIVRIGAPSKDWDDSELPNIILSAIKK